MMDESATVTPLLLRPEEAARVLGVGRSTLFELLRSGVLRSVKIGSCRRISANALGEYVERLDRAS